MNKIDYVSCPAGFWIRAIWYVGDVVSAICTLPRKDTIREVSLHPGDPGYDEALFTLDTTRHPGPHIPIIPPTNATSV